MRLVLDSNMIVAAFAGRGLCSSLFELCLDRYTVLISDHILTEVKNALHNKLKMPLKNAGVIIDFLSEFCTLSSYAKLPSAVCRDKSDDDIIALAVSNDADYIITGDNDLPILKKYKSIKIISPRDFWTIVRNIK